MNRADTRDDDDERIRDWVERQLATAPPLSDAIRQRLAPLLDLGGGGL